MRVIPVIDLKRGVAVHAVRGDRERYRPLRSRIADGSDPVHVARAVRERLERALPPAYEPLARLAAETRRELRAAGRHAGVDDWLAALDEGLRALLAGAPDDEAARRLRARLERVACA
jgi:phosphoribosylformimino-5-aminoimidazole carboxamide ribotide isomerase